MTSEIVIVGAGGFGREAIDVLRAMNSVSSPENQISLLGVVDDGPSARNLERLSALGVTYLGTGVEWRKRGETARFILAIGSPAIRERLSQEWLGNGFEPSTLVHPSAVVGSLSRVGVGSVVCGGVQVSTNVKIGSFTHLNPNSTVGHDTTIESFVSINPGAIVSGDVTLKSRVLVGAGALVLEGKAVGPDSIIGGGACLTSDTPGGLVLVGVPARPVRQVF